MSIALLQQYMQQQQLNQSQVATQLNVSTATISQYLHGKYAGDVSKLDKAIEQLVERQIEKAKTEVKTDFVYTSTAKKILELCNLAHVHSDIRLVIGEAGLGKTMALHHYAKQNRNVILLEIEPTYSVKVLLEELCAKLGIVVSRNNHDNMRAIIEKLKDSERLLIVDEAELLAYKSLEVLRRIHDKAGIGMVLAGLPRLRANLRGSKGEYRQLYSRVGFALDIKERLPSGDIALLCENTLNSSAFNAKLEHVSKGNARRLSKILRGVHRTAQLNKTEIDEGMIQLFSQMLID